jgi:dihydroorotase-like cyclic amidohydrolase
MPEIQSVPVDVVDSHIHSRQKPTGIKTYEFDATHVFADLENSGVMMAHEMPNTTPPLTTYVEIKSRIEELKHISNYGGLYFCYNGKNLEELKSCLADPEIKKYIV